MQDKQNTEKNRGKNGRIENLIPWLPGQSGNPNGRPKLTDIEKKAREAARAEIARYQIYREMTIDELKKIDTAKLPIGDTIFVKRLLMDLRNGNTDETHRYFNRLLGAPKQDGGSGGIDLSGATVSIKISTNPNGGGDAD